MRISDWSSDVCSFRSIPLFNACNVGAQASVGRLPAFHNPSPRREAKLNAEGGDIAADLRNAISKALRDRLGHVPMFIFTVENRFASGKSHARLNIRGTIESHTQTYADLCRYEKPELACSIRTEDSGGSSLAWHRPSPASA